MSTIDLNQYLDTPTQLLTPPLNTLLESIGREEIEAFQLEAVKRKVERQAKRIPLVREMLEANRASKFECFDDFAAVLYEDGVYKNYDQAWLKDKEFAKLTRWLDGLTSHDLSGVDMDGCDSLTEWCRRLDEQADIFVCHSTGTSGVLSFVPRSRADRDLIVDSMVWGNPLLFDPNKNDNDVTYFTMHPRRQYRILQALFDGLEERYLKYPVQAIGDFLSPEFAITQGMLRQAAASGTLDECYKNPIVAANRDAVERYQRELPQKIKQWTDNLIENYRGKRVFFQGSFDKAWQITQSFRKAGVTGAFDPDSVFSLVGGVKDGTKLPADWQEQFRQAVGVDAGNMTAGWGMSELVASATQVCLHGMHHFYYHSIPFVLEPNTRNPLPRSGVQTGQLAVLDLNSEDCWGGIISGDRGTIQWDSVCSCGREGPLLEAGSVGRL
ncbi:Uncharacterised protein [Halioglobus japonicus]|nr:Uncharacterised protein [Halioglobus japonicus]